MTYVTATEWLTSTVTSSVAIGCRTRVFRPVNRPNCFGTMGTFEYHPAHHDRWFHDLDAAHAYFVHFGLLKEFVSQFA